MDIRELHKYQIQKERKKIIIYDKVLSRCFHKIKIFAKNSQTYCFFEVPNIILGLPYFNLDNCIHYIMQRLIDYNFKAIFINPNILFITWDIRITKSSPPKKISNEHKFLDLKIKRLNTEKDCIFQKNNYKSIEKYKPSSKLIYDHKSISDFNKKANRLLINNNKKDFFNL